MYIPLVISSFSTLRFVISRFNWSPFWSLITKPLTTLNGRLWCTQFPFPTQSKNIRKRLLHRIGAVILEKQTLLYIICNFQQKNFQIDNNVLQTTMPATCQEKKTLLEGNLNLLPTALSTFSGLFEFGAPFYISSTLKRFLDFFRFLDNI